MRVTLRRGQADCQSAQDTVALLPAFLTQRISSTLPARKQRN
jgi:hypothetical protein